MEILQVQGMFGFPMGNKHNYKLALLHIADLGPLQLFQAPQNLATVFEDSESQNA